MLKCIGSKCPCHFSSDIYTYCTLLEKYIVPGCECTGIKYADDKKIELKFRIKTIQKELDTLKHLYSHIKKNQHLIGE